MVSDERALATWLAARDDVGLARTFAGRGVPPTSAWHDFFDAAEGLLDAASLDRALTGSPAATSPRSRAATAEPIGDALATSRCSAIDGRPYRRRRRPGGGAHAADRTPSRSTLDVAASVRPRADDRTAAAAAERAFTTAGALADVLLACLHAPLVAHRHGLDQRRRPQAAHRSRAPSASAEELEDLVESAAGAGLARALEREWVVDRRPASAGSSRRRPSAGRSIAEGFRVGAARRVCARRRAASPTRRPGRGAYPLDPGVAGARRPAAPHRRALGPHRRRRRRAGVDRERCDRAAPPIPLRSPPTSRPRSIASTCRPTSPRSPPVRSRRTSTCGCAASPPRVARPGIHLPVHRRLARCGHDRGRDGELDPRVPRDALAHRHPAAAGRTSSRAPPPGTDWCGCARTTRPAGRASRAPSRACSTRSPSTRRCDRSGSSATTARSPRASRATPSTGRSPMPAIRSSRSTPAGAPEPLHRRAPRPTASPRRPRRADLRARSSALLRGGHSTEGEAAWLGRELEQAVRARAEIVVVVRMPDGAERAFTLEATGLGGGRLRGRDRAADIERTFPSRAS